MSELVLVGVVHRDPQGASRLAKLLEREQPAAIGLELSQPSVDARRRRGAQLRARLESALQAAGRADLATAVGSGQRVGGRVGELAAAIAEPFELLAAEQYARAHSIPLELLDDPGPAARAVEVLETELLAEANVRALLEEDARSPLLGEPIEEQYRLARRYFGDARLFRFHYSAGELEALAARDAYVTRGLERMLAAVPKVVYVAGWEHLIDAGIATLGTLWKGKAKRVLLDA